MLSLNIRLCMCQVLWAITTVNLIIFTRTKSTVFRTLETLCFYRVGNELCSESTLHAQNIEKHISAPWMDFHVLSVCIINKVSYKGREGIGGDCRRCFLDFQVMIKWGIFLIKKAFSWFLMRSTAFSENWEKQILPSNKLTNK